MSIIKKFIWAPLIMFHFIPLCCQEDDRLRHEIEKIIRYDTDVLDGRTVGFILGVVDHDSVSISSFGSLIQDSVVVISDQSIFEIGGLSKVFTAHLCQLLATDQIINLEKPVNEYLPQEYRNEYLKAVKVAHLLTHTSGFPTLPNNLGQNQQNDSSPYATYSKEKLLQYYQSINKAPVLNKYIYSHINYALLEIIVEKSTGERFADMLSKYIFIPAGMTSTFIECMDCNIALGYDRSKRPADPWVFPSFAGSEGLKSTVIDLCNYMRWLFNSNDVKKQFEKLLVPYQKIGKSKKSYIARGWHLFKNKRWHHVYLHSGKTGGHAASIHFVIETKTAVVLITNTLAGMDGLATLTLRLINNNWKRNE